MVMKVSRLLIFADLIVSAKENYSYDSVLSPYSGAHPYTINTLDTVTLHYNL